MSISFIWIFIICLWLLWVTFAFNITLRKIEDFVYHLNYNKNIRRLYDLSGMRAIKEKIVQPPKEVVDNPKYRKPSSFLLWFVGIYIALFGIATNRYENRVDLIDNRVNSIFAQLASKNWKNAFSRINNVQNMTCPYKPEIFRPISIYRSFFYDIQHKFTIDLLKETIEDWKDNLEGVDLSFVNIENIDLENALLKNADLSWTNLNMTNLIDANFEGANLFKANLEGADLADANFKEASLLFVNLSDCSVTPSQLCEAKTIYGSNMDSEILKEIRKICPEKHKEVEIGFFRNKTKKKSMMYYDYYGKYKIVESLEKQIEELYEKKLKKIKNRKQTY